MSGPAGRISEDMRSPSLLLALAAALAASSAPTHAADLPRGELVPQVACADNPAQTYSLYLPAGYRPDRPWPVLYVLDARAGGPRAAKVFQQGAEKYGYIVVSSNNSMSDTVMEPNFQAMRALWADTHARFAIDDRRVYAAGYSGTVRAAITLALAAPGTITGIIGAGAGFPFDRPPAKDTPFLFFGTVGVEDFNYYELLDLDTRLTELGLPHRVEVFDGIHDWPPPDLAARALAWMELKVGKSPALAEALWQDDLARARSLEQAGDLFQAHRAYTALAADFAGLKDTAEAAQKAAAIAASEAFQRDRAARLEREKREKEYLAQAPGILANVNPSGEPVAVGQIVAALKIPELRKKAATADDPEERRAAKRLLNTVNGQTAHYLPEMFIGRQQWDRALSVLSVAVEINPKNSWIWYTRAQVHAHKGDRKKAFADLRKAVEMGWNDLGTLQRDTSFDKLRGDEGYKEIVKSLTAGKAAGG